VVAEDRQARRDRDRLGYGDVEAFGDHAHALAARRLEQRLDLPRVAHAGVHGEPAPRELERDRAAEPAPRARHERCSLGFRPARFHAAPRCWAAPIFAYSPPLTTMPYPPALRPHPP